MTGVVQTRPSAYSRAALARPGMALAASVLVHWTLLSAPLDTPWRGVALYPGDAPITVRLAPAPVPVPEVPASPEPEARRMPQQPGPRAGSAGQVRSKSSLPVAAQTETGLAALPQAADPSYYTARDLDRYPAPLVPFRINRAGGDGLGEIRLEILIDEHGIVQEMTIAGPAAPARAEEELRAALAATRFLPAQKDGRAVKSRIVLSVGYDPKDGAR
jgi:hypothetical protein